MAVCVLRSGSRSGVVPGAGGVLLKQTPAACAARGRLIQKVARRSDDSDPGCLEASMKQSVINRRRLVVWVPGLADRRTMFTPGWDISHSTDSPGLSTSCAPVGCPGVQTCGSPSAVSKETHASVVLLLLSVCLSLLSYCGRGACMEGRVVPYRADAARSRPSVAPVLWC